MAFEQTTRIGIDVNLPTGSSYDILLVSTPEGYPSGKLEFVFENTPRKITGIQKVAQFFLKILFTQKGSDVIHVNQGTIFPKLCIGANRTRDDSVFLSAVSSAVKDAEGQTRNLLAGDKYDLASQLDKVIVQGLNTNSVENLEMYLQLVTMAGETASVAIPFPQLDMKLANG